MLRGAGGPPDVHKRLLAYLGWTTFAVQMLANQVSDADLRALVLTRRYELLLSGVGTMRGSEAAEAAHAAPLTSRRSGGHLRVHS